MLHQEHGLRGTPWFASSGPWTFKSPQAFTRTAHSGRDALTFCPRSNAFEVDSNLLLHTIHINKHVEILVLGKKNIIKQLWLNRNYNRVIKPSIFCKLHCKIIQENKNQQAKVIFIPLVQEHHSPLGPWLLRYGYDLWILSPKNLPMNFILL